MSDLNSEIRQIVEAHEVAKTMQAETQLLSAARAVEEAEAKEKADKIRVDKLSADAVEAVEVFKGLGIIAIAYEDSYRPPYIPPQPTIRRYLNPITYILEEYQAGLRGDEEIDYSPKYPLAWTLTENAHTISVWGYKSGLSAKAQETAQQIETQITTHYYGLLLTTNADLLTYKKKRQHDMPAVKRPQEIGVLGIDPDTIHAIYIDFATKMLTS